MTISPITIEVIILQKIMHEHIQFKHDFGSTMCFWNCWVPNTWKGRGSCGKGEEMKKWGILHVIKRNKGNRKK